MKRTDRLRLTDARDRTIAALTAVERTGFEEIWISRQARQSLIFDVVIICEGLGGVSGAVQSVSSSIPWRSIRGTRNRLVHEYWLEDESTIANLVMRDLKVLLDEIVRLIAFLDEELS